MERLLATVEAQVARADKLEERLSGLELQPAVTASNEAPCPVQLDMIRQAQLRAVNRAAVEAGAFGTVKRLPKRAEECRGREAGVSGYSAGGGCDAANEVEWKSGKGVHATRAKKEGGTSGREKDKGAEEEEAANANAEDSGEDGRLGVEDATDEEAEEEGKEGEEEKQVSDECKGGKEGETGGSKANEEGSSQEERGTPGQLLKMQANMHAKNQVEGGKKDEQRQVSDNDRREGGRSSTSLAKEEKLERNADGEETRQQIGNHAGEGGGVAGQGGREEGAAPGEDANIQRKDDDSGKDVGGDETGARNHEPLDAPAGVVSSPDAAEAVSPAKKALSASPHIAAAPNKVADELFLRLCAAVAEVEGMLELEGLGVASLYAAQLTDAGQQMLEAPVADQCSADWQLAARELATALEALFEEAEA